MTLERERAEPARQEAPAAAAPERPAPRRSRSHPLRYEPVLLSGPPAPPPGEVQTRIQRATHTHLAPGQGAALPDEAWHLVQPREGRVRPMAQLRRRALNDDEALEREADVMGSRVQRLGLHVAAARQPAPFTRIRRAASGTIRRYPVKKNNKDFSDPMWYDSDHPQVELICLEKDVYRIKGTEQTVEWHPSMKSPSQYHLRRASGPPLVFDMDAYAKDPQFLDFMTMFKEVAAATATEKDADVKRALQLHVLQRFIVTALYTAKEIAKMNYQASPLNFQDGGNYVRSHATAFVDALHARYGGDADVHLVRSKDFNEILGQFLERFDAAELAPDISAKVAQIAQFALDRKGLEGFSDAYGGLFADVSKSLGGAELKDLKTVVTEAAERINKKVFADSFDAVVKKFVDKEYADAEAGQKAVILAELTDFVLGKRADLPTFLAYINPKRKREFEQKRAASAAVLDLAVTASTEGKSDELATQFASEIGAFKNWLSAAKDKDGRVLTEDEKNFIAFKGDLRPKFKALVTTQSFRDYLAKKKQGIEVTTFTDLTLGTLHTGELKLLIDLKKELQTKLPEITMVGGSIMLRDQPAFLLAPSTSKEMVGMVEFGLNKAGYVPTPTAVSRKLLASGASLQEIVAEVARQQREHHAGSPETKAKLQRFIDEVTKFDPSTYVSTVQAIDQLKATREAFDRFATLVTESKDYVTLQAASVAKLIEGLQVLDDKSPLPAIALQELRVNLQDAVSNKDDIAAFIRNIQNIHEVLILTLERRTDAAALVAKDLHIPPDAKSPHVTDYGLKAFAQAYNAVVAQRAGQQLSIDAFSSIYFELTHKLGHTAAKGGEQVTVRNPKDVEEFKKLEALKKLEAEKKLTEGVVMDVKGPDLVLIDIHPNDASKSKMARQQVIELIQAMFADAKDDYRTTVIVDITLNHVSDPAVKEIKDQTQKLIDAGKLNLVFIQSLTKFAEMGSDKQSGGLMFHYNDDKNWTAFNKTVAEAVAVDTADVTAERYFRALLKYCEAEQVRYIDKVRANTKYVYDQLTAQFAKLGADPKTIELSLSTDPGSCYVAFNYEELAAKLFAGDKARDVKTESLGKRILNDAIYELINKLKLPLSMRQSFGFPISNLGEAWVGSRFTIGTETTEMLDHYIRVITYVKAKLAAIPDADMKDGAKRRPKFRAISNDIADLNELRVKLEALLATK